MRESIAISIGHSTRYVETMPARQVITNLGDNIHIVEMMCNGERRVNIKDIINGEDFKNSVYRGVDP